jgi:hypothetical protein
MKKKWKILNSIVLGYLVLVCILGMTFKQITFGWGLADLVGYIILIGGTILHSILTFFLRNKKEGKKAILTIFFLMFSIFISLKATIWRGNEYSWNGSLFYLPCPSKIEIKDEDLKKEILIQMCSMEYHSMFSGKWNGEEIEEINGEVKIPNELKTYIDYPISKILIQSSSRLKKEDDEIKEKKYFELDSLRLNKEYILAGELIKIINRKPMFKVRIKNNR